MKTCELVYTRRAADDVAGLDALARKRIARKIIMLCEDPAGKSRKLINPRIGQYRFRIGDMRVIFDLHGLKVIVLRVGNRREVYR